MQRSLDVGLQLLAVNFVYEVDFLQSLCTWLQHLLVGNNVSVVRRRVSRVHVEVDCMSHDVSIPGFESPVSSIGSRALTRCRVDHVARVQDGEYSSLIPEREDGTIVAVEELRVWVLHFEDLVQVRLVREDLVGAVAHDRCFC